MEGWRIGQVSLTELWGVTEVAGACEGSIRYLVGCLGGFGDCQAIPEDGKQSVREGDHEITQCHDEEFKVIAQDGALVVVWTRWAPPRNEAKHDESWGVKEEHMRGGQAGEAGGW